jgi:hypothetical protein
VPFTGDGLLQWRRRSQGGGAGVSDVVAQERGVWGERDEEREVPKLYMATEKGKEKWKGAAVGALAIDGRWPSREVGPSNGREVEGGGGAAINCHKSQVKEGRGAGEAKQVCPGCGDARPGGAEEGTGGRREREATTGGPRLSATHKKKIKKK